MLCYCTKLYDGSKEAYSRWSYQMVDTRVYVKRSDKSKTLCSLTQFPVFCFKKRQWYSFVKWDEFVPKTGGFTKVTKLVDLATLVKENPQNERFTYLASQILDLDIKIEITKKK